KIFELREDRGFVSDENENAAVERDRALRGGVQGGRVEGGLRGKVLAEGLERRVELDVVRGRREDSREAREGLHRAVLQDVPGLPGFLRRDVAARKACELREKLLERGARHLRGDVGAGAERAARAAAGAGKRTTGGGASGRSKRKTRRPRVVGSETAGRGTAGGRGPSAFQSPSAFSSAALVSAAERLPATRSVARSGRTSDARSAFTRSSVIASTEAGVPSTGHADGWRS